MMASTFWIGTNVKVTNGSATVEVTSGDVITKVKENAAFVASNFSLPYEVDRTYTNNGKDYIVLKENWQGASGTGLNAVAVTSPAGIEEARQTLLSLISTYENFANSVKPTVEGNAVVQRTSAGRIKTANAVSSDEAVAYGQLGSAATKNVGTSNGNVMEIGAFGLGSENGIGMLGETSANDINKTGFYYYNNSTLDTPVNNSYGTLLHQKLGANAATQLAITTQGSRVFSRYKANNSWDEWVEVYHSGNSVNPLDVGLGGNGASIPDDNANLAIEGGIYRATSSTANLAFSGTSTLIVSRSFNVVAQIQTDGNKFFTRRSTNTGSTWTSWSEHYHSGNTNFNEVLGDGTTGLVLWGQAYNSTEIRFYIPVYYNKPATGITVFGTFSLSYYQNPTATGLDGGDITFLSSSRNLAVVRITGLSNLDLSRQYNLFAEQSSANIKVNF